MVREITYEFNSVRERARVLDDSVFGAYQDSVKSAYNSSKARKTLSQFRNFEGELTGSSPFMLTHLQNSELLGNGVRLATRQDLETARGFGLDLSGSYVDFGLALGSEMDSYTPNSFLARSLAERLKSRGIELGNGKLIPISSLKLREIKGSRYGLVFDLKEDVKELQDLSDFKWDFSRKEGLSRIFLNRYGGWCYIGGSLTSSGDDGRVVVFSAEDKNKKRSNPLLN